MMDYSEELADRVRRSLAEENVKEGSLLGGKSFWVDDRLVISVHGDDLLVRVPEEEYTTLLEQPGVSSYEVAARPVPGWVIVASEAIADEAALMEWVTLGLARPADD